VLRIKPACRQAGSVVADSLVLRNRQHLIAAKRYQLCYDDRANIKRQKIKYDNRTF